MYNPCTDYKQTREIVSAPKVKIFQTDNLKHDGKLWGQVFKEDLQSGVSPHTPHNPNFPTAGIKSGSYEYLTTKKDSLQN